jgi:putative ABC transport system permease protein
LVVINTEAFGWRLPVYLFPLDWLWLVTLSLLAALLAALLPAWRLFRLQPSALLKVFSSER